MGTRLGVHCVILVVLLSVSAKAERPKLERSEIVQGKTRSGVVYYVRVPESFNPREKMPALALLHGPNVNGKAYVRSVVKAWPRLADRHILIGINGDVVEAGSEKDPRCNYIYREFMGKSRYRGKGVKTSSSFSVVEALNEARSFLSISKLILIGHLDGGDLAYFVLMNHPDQVDGVVSVAGRMLPQTEPGAFTNKKLREEQRKVPVAVVHGGADSVVPFEESEYAVEALLDDEFSMVRLFVDPTASNLFWVLPVKEAVDWLEGMTGGDLAKTFKLAQRRLSADAMRDHLLLCQRARSLDKGRRYFHQLGAMQGAARKKARLWSDRLVAEMKSKRSSEWIDGFIEFRDQYALSDGAHKAIKLFDTLRARRRVPAAKLYEKAVRAAQAGEADVAEEAYRKIVDEHPASCWYRLAKRRLGR